MQTGKTFKRPSNSRGASRRVQYIDEVQEKKDNEEEGSLQAYSITSEEKITNIDVQQEEY